MENSGFQVPVSSINSLGKLSVCLSPKIVSLGRLSHLGQKGSCHSYHIHIQLENKPFFNLQSEFCAPLCPPELGLRDKVTFRLDPCVPCLLTVPLKVCSLPEACRIPRQVGGMGH